MCLVCGCGRAHYCVPKRSSAVCGHTQAVLCPPPCRPWTGPCVRLCAGRETGTQRGRESPPDKQRQTRRCTHLYRPSTRSRPSTSSRRTARARARAGSSRGTRSTTAARRRPCPRRSPRPRSPCLTTICASSKCRSACRCLGVCLRVGSPAHTVRVEVHICTCVRMYDGFCLSVYGS